MSVEIYKEALFKYRSEHSFLVTFGVHSLSALTFVSVPRHWEGYIPVPGTGGINGDWSM